MIRRVFLAGAMACTLALAGVAQAQDQKAPYTVAEYNAYQACNTDTNPVSKLKCFEGFEATYPQSTLLPYPYAHWQALQAAGGASNWPKIIEYADRLMASDKTDDGGRFSACFGRANAFHRVNNPRAANAAEMNTKARASADECLAVAGKLTKPEGVEQAAFDAQIKGAKTLLYYTIGVTSSFLKDFPRAVEGYKGALAADPNHAFSRYQLGVSYLQLNPSQYMDGFWSLAQAINMKVAGEAQVRSYLRNQLMRYQGGLVQCDKETDAQIAELIALATPGAERPADFSIPAGADIEAVQKQINILSMIKGLQAGGKDAKVMWLASCGLEFPEVIGKVISVADNGSGPVIQVYTSDNDEEIEKATAPNLEVHVADQPEAIRLKKDEPVKFAGHVARFAPDPFLIIFDKAKVDPEAIPPAPEPAATKKGTKKAPAKKRPPATP